MADTNTSTSSTVSSTSPTSSSTPPPTSSSPTNTPPPPPTSSNTPPSPTSTPTHPPSTSERPTSETTPTPTPTTTLSPSTATSSSTQTSLSTTAGGGTVTFTSVVAVTSSGSSTIGPSGTSAPGASKTFFQNTGAIAGVFTVVGLIVVGLFIALVTNTLRRRRAKRFDRETEEAAAEAAAAAAPTFLDDDDDPYGPRVYGTRAGAGFGAGGYGNRGGDGYDNSGYSADRTAYSDGVGQYSDVSSHGTYGQPAMSASGHQGETYNMRELGPGVGELYNPHGGAGMHDPGMMAAGAGAAGIGVMRARSTRDPEGYANALNDGSSPYPAFATPGGMHGHSGQQPQQHDYNNIGGANSGANGALLDAAGLGAGAGVQRGISLQHQPSHPSDLSRNHSSTAGTRSPESYASHYEGATSVTSVGSGGDKYSGFGMPHYVPPQHQGADLRRNPSTGHSIIDDVDPYGGYEAEPAHGKGVRGRYADGDESSGEEDERMSGRRILKVANE